MFFLEKRGFGGDSGDSLDDSPGSKAAHKTVISTGGSTCRHGHAWIGTEDQSNWPKMRKTLGKPGFLSGEDRNRTFGCFSNVLRGVRKVQIYLSFKRTTKHLLGLVRVNTLTFKDLDVTINSSVKRKIE
jgi:hypothetical protein